jgi:hypothetical protein
MLSDGIISKVLPNNPVLLKNFKNSRDETRDVIFGKHVSSVIGLAVSGAVAKTTGTVTPLQVATNLFKTRSLNIANMTAAGTVASAGVNILLKNFAVYVALEGGIIIGSGINAAIQTYIQQE